MSIFFVAILAVSVSPSDGKAPSTAEAGKAAAAPSAQPTPRMGRELADAAHATLQRWAKATDQQADAAARELLTVYGELHNDTKLARSQRESLRITIRGRLDQLSTQITKRIAKEKAAAKSDKKGEPAPKSVAATGQNKVLAQGGAGMAGGAGLGGGGYGGANGANANSDNGEQLVDLIQNVISPKSWEANGGACTIYYWQQQRAIVVRATGDVHGEISDTLEQLNRATH